jgi:hypothetical protein
MSRLFRTLLRWLTESIIVHRPLCSCALCALCSALLCSALLMSKESLCSCALGSVLWALCSVLCALLAHVEGIRAPLSASLFRRRERNRSHDDESHRHARRFLLSASYPPVIQTSRPRRKNFAEGTDLGRPVHHRARRLQLVPITRSAAGASGPPTARTSIRGPFPGQIGLLVGRIPRTICISCYAGDSRPSGPTRRGIFEIHALGHPTGPSGPPPPLPGRLRPVRRPRAPPAIVSWSKRASGGKPKGQ